jgi:PAS domain S-box-containing protein
MTNDDSGRGAVTASRSPETFRSVAERDDFLRTIGDKLPDAFFFRVVHDADGAFRFTYISSGCKEVTGLCPERLFGRATELTDLIIDEDRNGFWEAMGRALGPEASLDHVVRLRRPDGQLRWCHFRSGVRPGENGSSICEGILLDITDRRSVEAALGDSTARNDAILAALPDLMFVMSREGHYLDYHARDPQELLLPPEAFLGKHMSEVLPPDLVKPFQRSFDQVFKTGGSAVVDYSLDINGERRYYEARVVGYGPDRILSIIRDVTESKRSHDEAEYNRQELARVSRMTMLGEIAASLAHELNQPLAAILNNSQAAQRLMTTGRAKPDDTMQILGDIADDCQRAGEVIWRLRGLLSRDESSRQSLSLNQVAHDVQHLLRSELITRHARMTMALGDSLPEVVADRVQLQQVVLNLALNALDAMSEHEPAERHMVIATSSPGSFVQVDVRDHGPGIAAEHLGRLFDPFFTTKPSGLGMGLRICSSIVRSHGGRIWAANNAEAGATFSFTIPLPPFA